jgi:hypothetical protein
MLVSSVFAGVALADDHESTVDKNKINVTSLGIDYDDELAKYRITNDNDQNVTLTWSVYGGDQSGTVEVGANDTTNICVEGVTDGKTTIVVKHDGQNADTTATNPKEADFGEPNEEEPKASITFDAQQSDGESVMVEEVTMAEGGFVVITNAHGEVIGTSEYLEAGTHENVEIELDQKLCKDQKVKATIYSDTTGNQEGDWNDGSYDCDNDGDDDDPGDCDGSGDFDQPYEQGGEMVSDWACITIC